jgi:hypothetical protein
MAKPVAGGSPAKANPKVPNRASENESYSLVEDVNAGPHGAPKGKPSPGHMQNSNEMGQKNELVGVNGNLQDPYRAKGSDWADGKTSADAGHGQGSGATWENRDGGGKNQLCDDSENQGGPRFIEDDGCGDSGAGTPVPGNRAARVAANFSVSRNDGESRSDGGEVGIPQSINLQTGYIVGGDVSVVDEVPQFNVNIPSAKSSGFKSGRVARDLK